eukprot:3021249-Prymnesium_polylepis.1
MPTRRLTRTLDRPASCLRALLAPNGAATIRIRRGTSAQVRPNALSRFGVTQDHHQKALDRAFQPR